MKVPARTMDDHLADVARQLPDGTCLDMQDVECNAGVYPSDVFLEFRNGFDHDSPHRPYMHIAGEARSVRKSDGTPFYGDINEVTFNEGEGIPVDIFYDFTDDELSRMVGLGLYRRGFDCPSVIRDSELDMPVYCEVRVVTPQAEGDVPVLFCDIEDRHTIECDEQTCGYTFGDYFEKVVTPEDEFGSAFDDYADYDVVDEDMFGDDTVEHVVEDEPEHKPELTPEQKRIEAHYRNIRERVETKHMRNVPHKTLGGSALEAQVEDGKSVEAKTFEEVFEDTRFGAHFVAKDVVDAAKSFDDRMDERDAAESDYLVGIDGLDDLEDGEPESAEEAWTDADDADTLDVADKDDGQAEADADVEVEDGTSDASLASAGRKSAKRIAVEANAEANLADDAPTIDTDGDGEPDARVDEVEDGKIAAKPHAKVNPETVHKVRRIPSHFADIAGKADAAPQFDAEFYD